MSEKENEEPSYRAKPDYLENCIYLVIIFLLERFPDLKDKIKRYLETSP